ncbi:AMP-dependent synthetase/ligase [Polycladidibacter stylochi]|uniref:AMP-dependent synthetase/ligase n=1 Tax=Polycladidibacter stylochi TaxID=1807766 RepID=UPI000830E60A|nr:long-chain fatty acid--CoA ligase [Pseudovibrio stylochi]
MLESSVGTCEWQGVDGFTSIPHALLKNITNQSEQPAYYIRGEHEWEMTNWAEYGAQVRQAARALIALGVHQGDSICILSYNRPEWTILDMAAMMIGVIPTGIYWTAAVHEISYILRHSQAKLLMIENADQLHEVEACAESTRYLRHVVRLDGEVESSRQTSWDAFMALGVKTPELEHELERRLGEIVAEDIAVQIYTSGTTGNPKAVQLSHRALRAESDGLRKVQPLGPDDRYISYLPMAHVAEQAGTIVQASDNGYPVYYARSIQELGTHLAEVRPTVIFGVPRIYEKIMEKLQEKMAQATGIQGVLLQWAMGVGLRANTFSCQGQAMPAWLRLQKKIANKLILGKIKERLGLDQAKIIISGGAPLSRRVLDFFLSIDLLICEVYGQSENCGGATINRPGQARLGSVGQPLEGVEIKIAEDGEVLCRAATNFTGYAHDPDATDEMLRDGWLYSGDLGYLDDDGYLFITGRKKELIITSGGKNISPLSIERGLMEIPLVEYAVVAGNNRNYLTALLSLDKALLDKFCHKHGIEPQNIHNSAALKEHLQTGIDRVNAAHSKVEHIRKYKVMQTGFSVDCGELTPTLKVRRRKVLQNHEALVDALYDGSS